MTTEPKQQQLDWRRGKVLELSAQGYSEREIADTIQVNAPTVHRDLVHLREQTQENLQRHIRQTIPQEYQQSLTGINLRPSRRFVFF